MIEALVYPTSFTAARCGGGGCSATLRHRIQKTMKFPVHIDYSSKFFGALNPRRAGGGGKYYPPPLPFFVNN